MSLESLAGGAPARVDVAGIERALTLLWKEAASPREGEAAAVTRACLLNLVVWSAGAVAGRSLAATLARVVATHPSRVLLVEIDAAAAGGSMEAFISAYCHRPSPGARQVCCEQVTLRAAPTATRHLPALVASLEATDLPVCLFATGDPPLGDPAFARLAASADRLVVDSADFPDLASLRATASFAASPRRGALGDLNWRRLRAWQDMIAALFDAPVARAHLRHLSAMEVTGGPGAATAGLLLAGWVRTALDGRRIAFASAPAPEGARGELLAVRLSSRGGPSPADFVVEADPGSGFLTARVVMEGTCPLPRRARTLLPERHQLLCAQLESSGRDLLYEAALAGAASLA